MRDKKLIYVYLTNECNSRCKLCNIWKNQNGDIKELDIDVLKAQILDYSQADWVFGGGEATRYSKIGELLAFLSIKGISYTLLSNAVDYEDLSNLIDDNDIMNVTVSYDGVYHDKQRGVHGNLGNIIRLIRRYGNRIKLSYTISRYNVDHFEEDIWFAWKMLPVPMYLCLEQSLPIFQSTDEEKQIVVPHINGAMTEQMFDEKTMRYLYDFEEYGTKCSSPNDCYTIMQDGNVPLCQSFKIDRVLGNVYCDSLREIIAANQNRIWDECLNCEFMTRCKLVCQRRYDMR